jgi:hypothetical protein
MGIMDAPHPTPRDIARPRFHGRALALWLPACLAAGALVAKIAVVTQEDLRFTPILFFPILVGVGLGAILVAIMRFGQIGHVPTVVLGSILGASVVVVGQHYLLFRADLARQEQRLADAKAIFGDELTTGLPGFLEHLGHKADEGRRFFGTGPTVWLSWALDAVLLLVASVVVTATAARQPYCERCRSWYRTIRAGRLRSASARQLALLAAIEVPEDLRSLRFRLLSCTGGCSPTGFELFWEQRRGGAVSRLVWLDADSRDRVVRALDQEMHRDHP